MSSSLFIPGPLPTLNALLAAKRARRGKSDRYNSVKRAAEASVCAAIHEAQLSCCPVPAFFAFHWVAPNRRHDPDNIAAGGRKIIFDALVTTERMDNDGWKNVAGWVDTFAVATVKKDVGVRVEIRKLEGRKEQCHDLQRRIR